MQDLKSIKSLKQFDIGAAGKPVIYIAGKVTGLPWRDTYLKFTKAQIELEAQGYCVINPMNIVSRSANWNDAMRICISYIPHADEMFLLRDYKDSKGAMFELEIAKFLELEITEEV